MTMYTYLKRKLNIALISLACAHEQNFIPCRTLPFSVQAPALIALYKEVYVTGFEKTWLPHTITNI